MRCPSKNQGQCYRIQRRGLPIPRSQRGVHEGVDQHQSCKAVSLRGGAGQASQAANSENLRSTEHTAQGLCPLWGKPLFVSPFALSSPNSLISFNHQTPSTTHRPSGISFHLLLLSLLIRYWIRSLVVVSSYFAACQPSRRPTDTATALLFVVPTLLLSQQRLFFFFYFTTHTQLI